MANLPGSDKYRTSTARSATGDAPWQDPVVVLANTEVRIEEVLNKYFGMYVPADAAGWKTYCPFAFEHDDGGIDRQFRVYASSNTGHCFALHGTLDPVGLWRLRAYFPTLKDAAQDLLRTFGIDYRPRPYWVRMAALRQHTEFSADPDAVVQALMVYLASEPTYEARQYDENVLRSVNSVLSEVHPMCARATSSEEVETWFHQARTRLAEVLMF